MQKYIEEKCHYCLSIFCFFTPCWRWWHSLVSRLFNYGSFLKSHFEFVFICGCRQRAISIFVPRIFRQCKKHKVVKHMSSWRNEFGITGLKNGTPYHDSDTFVVAPNRGILMTLFNFELQSWRLKSMNRQLRKSANVAQKKRSSV